MAKTNPSIGRVPDSVRLSGEAAEALTAYKIAEYTSGNKLQFPAAQGNAHAGVTETAAALGEQVTIQTRGIAHVELGATLSANVQVTGATDGQAVAVTDGDVVVGEILEGGDAGDVVPMRLYDSPGSGAVADALTGVASGYKVARGVAAVTGTATVVTGLATVVAVAVTAQDDLDGDTLMGVSATIGDQAGTPAAGSVILKAWKSNGDGDATMVAADAAKNLNWIAIGT